MPNQKPKKTLLIEDDPLLYKVLSQRLKQEKIDVEVAVDGEEALKKAETSKPDLILLDIILPKKSGFEVLAELRKKPGFKKMPVVVLSNLGQEEDIKHMAKLGVQEYLVKADYSLSEMVDKVKEHLSKIK